MERRTLLRRGGAVGALALAGCLGQTNGPGRGSDGGDGTPMDTETLTPTPAEGSPVVDASIETVGGECAGDGSATATVRFDEDESTVAFDGVLQASTPCHRVTVESANYDADADSLAVVLGTTAGDVDACAQCLGALSFEGRVEFEGELPSVVTVTHGDEQLARAERGAATPTPSEPTAIEDVTFEVLGITSESQEASVDAEFRDDEQEVVFTGTIVGSDGCKTADLEGADYDADEDQVTLSVQTVDRSGTDGQACTQAQVYIAYDATVSFSGGTPRAAAVEHDGRGVMSAAHGTASASAPGEDG